MNGKGLLLTGTLGALLSPAVNGQYTSDQAYREREIQHIINHPVSGLAVYPKRDEPGRIFLEANVSTVKHSCLQVSPWPLMDLKFRHYLNKLPLWYEIDAALHEFFEDVPNWTAGMKFDKLQVNDKFYWLAGTEWYREYFKGVKVRATGMNGKWSADFDGGYGRKMVIDEGHPRPTNEWAPDAYATVSRQAGRRGCRVGISINFDDGEFRNLAARYGTGDFSVGLTLDANGLPGFNFNFCKALDKKEPQKFEFPSDPNYLPEW